MIPIGKFLGLVHGACLCIATCALVAPTTSALSSSFSDKAARDETVRTVNGDPVMVAAVRRARSELPKFLAMAESPPAGTSNFVVKIGIKYNEKDAEFFWIRPFKRDGVGFIGRLNNEPRFVKIVKLHDIVAFEEDSIVDWYYLKGDAMIGNFTACALLTKEPAQEREQYMRKVGLHCP